MTYQLGIDLGTTYTAAAVCRSTDRGWVEPEVVTLGTRGATVPSVLYIGDDGSVVVGEAAERRAVTDPDRVVREFKRRIGDPTPIIVAGRAWAPEELSARLVRWVVDRVAEREGGPASGIAVTHPASWGPHKKELLGAALAGQGLSVVFLAEPQAAALHYAAGERIAGGSTIAVYDLGGGTFDAAVVHKSDSAGSSGFGLIGRPEGLERLGGIDFDQVVFDHVVQGLPTAFENLDDTDPAVLSAVARIRRECTEAKEALSSDTEVSIPVLLPTSRGSVRLHRSEFEALIRRQVDETVTALRKAVGSAGLQPDQLTAVLLVGGSSRIPLVAQLVSEQLGRPVAVDADPKNAIAKGAALSISPIPIPAAPAPPKPAAAAAAGAVGAAAGAAMAPPPRPPRVGMPPQQQPGPRHAPAAMAAPPPRPQSGSIPHESANSLYSAADAPPPRGPARPQARHEEPDWDYDEEPRAARRPIGMLIGIGGVLAVLALVIGVMVWNANTNTAANVTPSNSGTTTEEKATKAPAKEPAEPAVPAPTKEQSKTSATEKPEATATTKAKTESPTTTAPASSAATTAKSAGSGTGSGGSGSGSTGGGSSASTGAAAAPSTLTVAPVGTSVATSENTPDRSV